MSFFEKVVLENKENINPLNGKKVENIKKNSNRTPLQDITNTKTFKNIQTLKIHEIKSSPVKYMR